MLVKSHDVQIIICNNQMLVCYFPHEGIRHRKEHAKYNTLVHCTGIMLKIMKYHTVRFWKTCTRQDIIKPWSKGISNKTPTNF